MLDELIGQGAFGKTYVGVDMKLKKDVAVKIVITPKIFINLDAVERVLRVL